MPEALHCFFNTFDQRKRGSLTRRQNGVTVRLEFRDVFVKVVRFDVGLEPNRREVTNRQRVISPLFGRKLSQLVELPR